MAGAPTLSNATSAVLTLADLAGSEAATLNTNHAVSQQGLAVNKSLHWLKVAVHDLAANRSHTQLRNSALTRLLGPSLSGEGIVAIIVTSSEAPPAKVGVGGGVGDVTCCCTVARPHCQVEPPTIIPHLHTKCKRACAQGDRETVEALQFGVAAGRITLAPTRRTEASKDGQLGELQTLLAEMAEEKSALATDAESLRVQARCNHERLSTSDPC